MCLHRARNLHGEASVLFHDQRTQGEFRSVTGIPQKRFEIIPLAHRSDLIRTWLLIQHGGVWADPTVYFNQPMDDWLPELLQPSGLFMFHRPGRDREISNWFIAAMPGHPILVRLFHRLCEFWSRTEFRNVGRENTLLERQVFRVVNRNRWAPRIWTWPWVTHSARLFPYMIYHYIFYDVISTDENLRGLWRLTPKVSADGPHKLLRMGLASPSCSAAIRLLEEPVAPVYKLKWKIEENALSDGSIIQALHKQTYS